jgi:hypothetical protein
VPSHIVGAIRQVVLDLASVEAAKEWTDFGGNVFSNRAWWRSQLVQFGTLHAEPGYLFGDELYFVSDDGIASCVNAKTGGRH